MTAGELLRELLDRAVDQARRLGVAVDQQLVELLLADLVGRRLAERILADLAQALAPIVEDRLERALAGAVADEALVCRAARRCRYRRERRRAARHRGRRAERIGRLVGWASAMELFAGAWLNAVCLARVPVTALEMPLGSEVVDALIGADHPPVVEVGPPSRRHAAHQPRGIEVLHRHFC